MILWRIGGDGPEVALGVVKPHAALTAAALPGIARFSVVVDTPADQQRGDRKEMPAISETLKLFAHLQQNIIDDRRALKCQCAGVRGKGTRQPFVGNALHIVVNQLDQARERSGLPATSLVQYRSKCVWLHFEKSISSTA